jgi:hypothetical protein
MTLGTIAPYLVTISAMLFSACTALILIYAVRHFDPPSNETVPERFEVAERPVHDAKVAV